MNVKRTHITVKPFEAVLPNTRGQQRADTKPNGFWYGVDGDWERWCKGEDWGLAKDKPNLEYELTLGDEQLLILSSVLDIDVFHEAYRSGKPGWEKEYINWEAVAEKYDGIEIAPYQWKRRLETPPSRWYYGWDCASGCIWRPRGVTVRLLHTHTVKV